MPSNIEVLLSRLTNVRKSGKEWVASCPAHADSTPSLGVKISESGKILIHCMAQCEPADILSAVGMELADLFPDRKMNGHVQPVVLPPEPERITCAPGRSAPTPALMHPMHGKPSMLHIYKTIDNQLLGYVMRFDTKEGKTFCPYTYSKSDGWKHKTFSKPRPLYGLPLLALRPSGARFLVEGEKAADALAALAPTNAVLSWCGGVAGVKHADLSLLAGQPIIIWPDADEPGRKACEELAERLHALQCSIRVVDTEGLPEGFDAADLKEPLKPWITPRLRAYTPRPAPEPEQPAPEPVAEPVAVPAKPVASVTPITEARTKQQKKPKAAPADDYAPFADDVMALAFTATHPELRYVARWGKWMAWSDADGWREDETLQVYDLARKICCAIADETRGATPSQVATAKSAGKRAAVENLARADRTHALTAEVWDTDKLALNTPGGLIDLRDGSMRPVRPDDYCRKRTAATPGGDCPQWMEFLGQCTDGDVPMQDYLARLAGMCCTGDTREDFLGFIYGPGGNGKSVFIDTIQNILGTYAINAGIETFTEQKSDKHTTELARLYGSRLVVAQETEQGRRWAESRLKLLTGGGKVTARFMRCDDFEFTPELKLVIVGNHKPSLRNVDAAFRRRFHLIPFVHVPPVIDRTLRQKLWSERDGILLWMIAGCADWLRSGLQAPESIRKATEEYFDTQDIIGQWINDMCETGNGCESTIRSLFTSYRAYCEGLHEFALRQGELRDALLCRPGISQGGYAKSPTIKGLRVRQSETHAAANSARYPGSED